MRYAAERERAVGAHREKCSRYQGQRRLLHHPNAARDLIFRYAAALKRRQCGVHALSRHWAQGGESVRAGLTAKEERYDRAHKERNAAARPVAATARTDAVENSTALFAGAAESGSHSSSSVCADEHRKAKRGSWF